MLAWSPPGTKAEGGNKDPGEDAFFIREEPQGVSRLSSDSIVLVTTR